MCATVTYLWRACRRATIYKKGRVSARRVNQVCIPEGRVGESRVTEQCVISGWERERSQRVHVPLMGVTVRQLSVRQSVTFRIMSVRVVMIQ